MHLMLNHPPTRDSSRARRQSSKIDGLTALRLRRVIVEVVRTVGERMALADLGGSEAANRLGHTSSRNDLEATGLLIRHAVAEFSREGLNLVPTFENEEMPLIPLLEDKEVLIRLVIDPIDGSKAFDDAKCPLDCPIPRPRSAVSVAAVCPVSGTIVASAVYCFDQGEVFSSMVVGGPSDQSQYVAFREETMLRPISMLVNTMPAIEAKRRVLTGRYNSRALVEIAQLELALMDSGLKPTFGGESGASAVDILNVVRGSFAACVDVRALYRNGGSVPYWYDVAGAVPVALGRGLRVVLLGEDGEELKGGGHAIYTPVAFVVARPDVADTVLSVVRKKLPCPLQPVALSR